MNYFDEVKNYTNKFADESIKKQYLKAVQTLRKEEEPKSWEWIYTALEIKSVADWNKWGFGLLFNWNFQNQVNNKIRIRTEAKEIDIDELWAELEEDEVKSSNDIFTELGIKYR